MNATPKWFVAIPHYREMGTFETYDDLNDFVFMTDTEPKFCKNCKFFKAGAIVDCCENPIFPKRTNVVSGEYHPNFCSDLRMTRQLEGYSYGLCGPEARYYEKRLSWWGRLFNK